jgi:hypothetical protein
LQEQQAFIESLAMRYNKFSSEVGEFMSGVGTTIANVESSCRDTQFQLKELKDYVDHFADNLVLSSGQITVETDAGFTPKPISLTETLKLARGTLTELETGAERTGERVEQIAADLETKAPDTVLFNVNTLERKVSTIEVHLRKEGEQGIGVSAVFPACVPLNAVLCVFMAVCCIGRNTQRAHRCVCILDRPRCSAHYITHGCSVNPGLNRRCYCVLSLLRLFARPARSYPSPYKPWRWR